MSAASIRSSEWSVVSLGDVAETCLGKMLDVQKNKGTPQPYLRNPNIRWFGFDVEDVRLMPFEAHEEERYGLCAGDVLVCEGGEAGRAAIWDGRIPGMKFQKAIHRVRCGPRLHNRFLVHRLMFDYFNGRLNDYYTGATIKHFTGQDLQRYRFLLPPLPEQRRIAEILDKADALRAKRRAAIAQLDTLTQSIFLDMFGDPVSNPKGFPIRTLSELYVNQIEGTKCGPFGSTLKKDEFVPEGVPVWNMDNIDAGGRMVMPFRMYIREGKFKQLESYAVASGDVLVSRAGTVGKMCVAGTGTSPSIISTNLIRLRFGPDLVPLYFVSLMTHCKGRVGRLKTGPDGALTHMNTGVLDTLKFPYPPVALQNRFASIVESIESRKLLQNTQLIQIESFFGALQQDAFNGAL